MSSARQLLDTGLAKRADSIKLRAEVIHAEPGFNLSETPEEFAARVAGMVLHLKQGGTLPPVEVRSRAEGGAFLVDGHARHAAYIEADAQGAPVRDPKDGQLYIPVVYFTGNDADRVARLVTSAEGRTLTPMQRAEAYKRLAAFGWSPVQIATKVGKHPDHVRDTLALALANSDVHQMVKAGEVSATVAAKVARKHGEKAGAVLSEQVAQAKAEGRRPSAPKKPSPARAALEAYEAAHTALVVLAGGFSQSLYTGTGQRVDLEPLHEASKAARAVLEGGKA